MIAPVPSKEEKPEDVHATPDVDEDSDEGEDVGADPSATDKKKKKKKKPKKKKAAVVQSEPPRVGLSKLFPTANYPEGEISEYKVDTTSRITSEEKRYIEREIANDPLETYTNIRRAAEAHRQARQYAQKVIKPGMTMTEVANTIENATRALVEEEGLESGVGFPTGLSLNEVAAHYTPNSNDTKVLQDGDIMKVDIGVHVKGRIVDSAFTMSWNPQYENLLKAVKDATNTGVREAGIDVRVGDLGGIIQEVMESYEVEVGGRTLPVKSIRNLTGHNIGRYTIHGGKSVPIVKSDDETKMEEGEYFAIETFGSTGRGVVVESGECSHYARMPGSGRLRSENTATAKTLLTHIDKHFGTLPWCRRYLERSGATNYLYGLKQLVREGIVQEYPPLKDQAGAMTAQFEHTILLRPTCKEVVSRGVDY